VSAGPGAGFHDPRPVTLRATFSDWDAARKAAGLLDHRGQVASKMVAPSGAIVLELTTDPYRRAAAEAVICLNGGHVAHVRATGATRREEALI